MAENDALSEPNFDGDDDLSFDPEAEDEGLQPGEESETAPAEAEGAGEPEGKGQEEGEEDVEKNHLAALQEERARRKELQDKLDNMQRSTSETLGQLREQFNTIREELRQARETAQEPQPDPEAEARKFEEDPVGYLREQNERLQSRLDEVQNQTQEQVQQTEQEKKQAEEFQQFQAQVNSQVNQFREQAPDYDQALQHLVDARTNELKAFGIEDPATVNQALQQEAIGIAQHAIQHGRNPGEVVYELAKLRGYQPGQAPADGGTGVEDKLNNLERGQQATNPMSGAEGGSKNLTASDLEKMSDDEFDKLWAEMEQSALGK